MTGWPISRVRNIVETTEIGKKITHPRAIIRTSFKVKGQRLRVTSWTNAETGSASYISNGKAYECETWYTEYEYPYRRRQAP